ncbi:MAG: hypothetical protein ACRDFT_02855 [bacterium]
MEQVKQRRFEWALPSETRDPNSVVMDPEATEVAIGLMARALIAVVRAVQEADDER